MNSNNTHTTSSLSNEEFTTAQSLSHEEFLQIKKNNTFKAKSEVSFKSEFAE